MKRSVLTVVLMVLFGGAFAQPGAPDITFGKNGKAMLTYPGAPIPNYGTPDISSIAVDIKVQPDQKIVVLALIDTLVEYFNGDLDIGYQYYLHRLNPNGTYDSTFGINGSTPIVDNERPASMELLPGGKILVNSQIAVNIDSLSKGINFCLSRYNADGAIDNTFGTNGKTITSFINCRFAIPVALFVLANGKIIQAGCGSDSHTFLTLARFNANGTIDPTYGVNGRVIQRATLDDRLANWGAVGLAAVTVIKLSDEKIVAAYNSKFPYPDSLSFMRFTTSGGVDTTFGVNGLVKYIGYFPAICGGAVLPDDKMVLIGKPLQAIRFKRDGSLDSGFVSQQLIPYIYPMFGPMNSKIIVEPNKKLSILYNESNCSGCTPGIKAYIGRLNPDGTPDMTFGKRGVREFPSYKWNFPSNIPPGSTLWDIPVLDAFTAFAIDSNSKYVLCGFRRRNDNIPGFDSGVVTRLVNNSRGRYYNTITGAVFYDQNHNGVQDVGEAIINNAAVSAIKPGVDTVPNWNMHGIFDLQVDTGIYTTRVNPAHAYFNAVPVSKTTSHATYFNTDTVSFALQPLPGKRDVSVTVAPLTSLIRTNGFPTYSITYENQGTDTIASGTVTFFTDTAMFYFNSIPFRDSILGNTIKWNFTNLMPQEMRRIIVYCYSGGIGIGQQVCVQAKIDPLTGDLDTANNKSANCLTGLSSYDPNDKKENHGGKIALSKAKAGEYLTYTIRFQNTGNDTAFNVYIRDTMDNKLDWNSFQILASSHNYQMTMNDGKCLFTFPDIKLVDSIKNEPKSHGYIVYKIKAKQNVQIGDVIKNTAAIYFDYNLPIFTNTEMTTVVAEVLPLKLLSFTARKQDKTNLLNWATAQEINVDRFEIERSTIGRDFSKIGVVSSESAVGSTHKYSFTDYSPLTTAHSLYYRLKMVDKDGQSTYSPIRQININHSTLNIAIFPNPAKDNLQMQIESDKKSLLQLHVLSGDGKVLSSKSIVANEGSSLQSIHISSLSKGSYFLKVIAANGNKEEQVIKFEKL